MAAKKPVRRSFYRRVFLNRPHFHTTAIILAKVRTSSNRRYVDGGALLTDCSDRITLDFGFSTESGRKNAVYKAERLARVFSDMAEVLANAELKTPPKHRRF